MGILSGIKKIGKKIFGGIKKVFKAIMKPINKILGSKWGRVLMTGLAIFTMGSALIAGGKAFAQPGLGFIDRFVQGGGAFIDSLIGVKASEGDITAAGGPGSSGLPQPMTGAGGGVQMLDPQGLIDQVPQAAAAAPQAAGTMGPPAALAGPGLAPVGPMGPPASLAGAEKSGGWLSKAAKGALDFAKTSSGGTIIGAMISGVGESINQKNQNEFDSRVQRQFADPNDPGMQTLNSTPIGVNAPMNRVDRGRQRRSHKFAPHIPFRGLSTGIPGGG